MRQVDASRAGASGKNGKMSNAPENPRRGRPRSDRPARNPLPRESFSGPHVGPLSKIPAPG